jgi:hypothetical protein
MPSNLYKFSYQKLETQMQHKFFLPFPLLLLVSYEARWVIHFFLLINAAEHIFIIIIINNMDVWVNLRVSWLISLALKLMIM